MSDCYRNFFDPSGGPEDARISEELGQVEKLLPRILQLKPKHRALLPQKVQQLSRMLTCQRGELGQGYLQSPPHFSAYVCYFLPWNLHRLTRLLVDLNLDFPGQARILDLGSGPLTFPLALWLARPDLREKQLTFICSDRSKKIMNIGSEILHEVMKKSGAGNSWKIDIHHAPLKKALESHSNIHLLSVCNVLNETGGKRGRDGFQQIKEFVRLATSRLSPEGRLLAVEPGTRIGGNLISMLRNEVLKSGFEALAPCTHQEECPLQGRQKSGWCHFNFKGMGVSSDLRNLTRLAGLDKDGLSLSFGLFGKGAQEKPEAPAASPARIVSNVFVRSGRPPAAYGCSSEGLLLVEDKASANLWQGRILSYTSQGKQDGKSGALLVTVND